MYVILSLLCHLLLYAVYVDLIMVAQSQTVIKQELLLLQAQ